MEGEGKERGDIDLLLILVFVVIFQILSFTSLQRYAEAWKKAYQGLEDSLQSARAPEFFSAFGASYPAPLARIDYGAYYQKDRDAEALCIIGRARLLETDFATFRCE